MPTPIQTTIRRATRNPEGPWNILTFLSHERYESLMAKTGHAFYSIQTPVLAKSDWNTNYAPVPENYTILPISEDTLTVPPWLAFDMILSQHKAGQFQIASQIARQLQIPLISMDHRLPAPGSEVREIAAAQSMIGDVNVFISEYQRAAWEFPDDFGTINYIGIDTNMFVPPPPERDFKREPWALSVVNDWINRDCFCGFTLWREITGFPSPSPMIPHRILGDTPGLSQPAPDIPTLVEFYQKAGVYLNTTTASTLPTVILEAMACGCPVVSTDTCLIPKFIIEHGVNGFVGGTADELRRYTHELLNNPILAKQIGDRGRKTIEEKFCQDRFIRQWNEIFQEASEIRR